MATATSGSARRRGGTEGNSGGTGSGTRSTASGGTGGGTRAAATRTTTTRTTAGSSETRRAPNQEQMTRRMAERTGLSQGQIKGVWEGLREEVRAELGKKGSGACVIAGLVKLERAKKAATKARPGFNPTTREPIEIPAKPAHFVVRAQPLAALKDMV